MTSISWNLYWVESDGMEDCFVIARNSRSARSVEYRMNGFDFDDVQATLIARIPDSVEYKHSKRGYRKNKPWPSYVFGKKIFSDIGAQFRNIDDVEEMLIDDTVFRVHDYAPCAMELARTIGTKSIEEMRIDPEIREMDGYDEEDIFAGRTAHVITMLGLLLVRCHQIEEYVSRSFLPGISKKQKSKYQTMKELKAGWKKKTFGNMLKSIEEAWEIDPTVRAGFELFLDMRNRLIHGITTDERFDIRTEWGEKELISFLYLFDVHSRIVKKAFRSSYYASVQFAIDNWGLPDGPPKRFSVKNKKRR
jgi:hypothetical protein